MFQPLTRSHLTVALAPIEVGSLVPDSRLGMGSADKAVGMPGTPGIME